MIVFPNAKINIGLSVTHKRADGFHDLETVFYPVPLCDALEILPNDKKQLDFFCTGLPIDNTSENLCIQACRLLKKDFPDLPDVQMYLRKVIPTGAGLGGGSADAAFTLTLLNDLFGLNLSEKALVTYALALGSDCPFFIRNKACIAKGRGEITEAIDLNLSGYYIVVVHPQIHINTGWAFKQLQPKPATFSPEKIAEQPVHTWKTFVKNDFEEPVFQMYPKIKNIKEQLYDKGAAFASMTGSGSSVYGLFKENPANISFGFNEQYQSFVSKL